MLQDRNSCFSLVSPAETTVLMVFPQVPAESPRKKWISSELSLIVAYYFLCLHLTQAPLACFLSQIKQICAFSCGDLRLGQAHFGGLLMMKLGPRHKELLVPIVSCGHSVSQSVLTLSDQESSTKCALQRPVQEQHTVGANEEELCHWAKERFHDLKADSLYSGDQVIFPISWK